MADIETIRGLRRAHPFRPFYLVLADGRRLPVDCENVLAISPDGRLVVFQTLNGWFERLAPSQIDSVDFEIDVREVQRQRLLAQAKTA